MLIRKLMKIVAPLALLAMAQGAAAATVVMTKSLYCTCCDGWADHMRKAGFKVVVQSVEDVTPTAKRLGVPDKLRSCHTAKIGDYVIEGHVPAAEVKRLLAQKPKAAGLSVPGMVVGSPGMETGAKAEPYKTLLFTKDGKTRVFASH